MLNLNLADVEREVVHLRKEIAPDDPIWQDTDLRLSRPIQLDLEARMVGEGVLVRGEMEGEVIAECRRCLVEVPVSIKDEIGLLYEDLSPEDEVELSGEVYPLPERGDELDLTPAIREQFLLRVPDYVVCSESCRGLCPKCGTDLNQMTCDCVPEEEPSPWGALKDIKFD
jgi:uncharacterized protein